METDTGPHMDDQAWTSHDTTLDGSGATGQRINRLGPGLARQIEEATEGLTPRELSGEFRPGHSEQIESD